MCLAIVNTGWNGVSQTFKCTFCNCDGLLLSTPGSAKLRVAVLSRAIAESWHTGMACTLNLIQKNCSELTSQLGTSVQQGTCSYGKGHLCTERPKWTGCLSEAMLEIQGMERAGCMCSKVPACKDKRYGRWEPACQNTGCTSCQSVWLRRAWAPRSSEPESELRWLL